MTPPYRDLFLFYGISFLQSRLTSRKIGVKIKEPMGKELSKEDDHGIWK
jgi:hypothetical protein